MKYDCFCYTDIVLYFVKFVNVFWSCTVCYTLKTISVTCVTTEKLKTAVSYAMYESSVNYVMTHQKSIHEILQQSLHYRRTTRDSEQSTNSLKKLRLRVWQHGYVRDAVWHAI